MFTVTLGGKTHRVDYVRAIVLREIQGPMSIVGKLEKDADYQVLGGELEKLVDWFCLFLGGDVSKEDIYNFYPADRLMHDITLAVLACRARVTEVLIAFPTRAA